MRGCRAALCLCLLTGCVSLPALQSLPVEEPQTDPLTLAAECLSRGDEPAAAGHFERYVRGNPEQLMFRVHLAELYLKIHRDAEAKVHFEQFVADAQETTGAPQSQLVHCHTKLMEIAHRADDGFGERLQRGIGLVVLARQSMDDAETREEILCQSIAALLEARELRPNDARVQVYLAEAHERAGNRRAADVARAAARNRDLPGTLTPCELRSAMR